MIEQLIAGFAAVLMDLQTILSILLGTAVGLIVGAIPGLTYGMALGLMIPVSFIMPPVSSIAMLIAVTKAGIFGGSISAILIGTPGTPAASATVVDGYELTKKGKQGKALKIALYASASADVFSNIVLVLVAYPLAQIALKFGPPEYFCVILFSLTIIGSLTGASVVKGLVSAAFGLLLSIIGLDPMSASPRWDFNLIELMEGFHIIPLMIGLFAIREILVQGEDPQKQTYIRHSHSKSGVDADNRISWIEFRSCIRSIARSAVIGTGIGALPGLGASIAAWVGYGMAKSRSKNQDEFGRGSIEGVAAAEAGNNAVDGANLIPLLTLGIPGNIAAALLLGAFMIHGIAPGPLLFQKNGDLVYALFAASFIAIFCYFLFGIFFIKIGALLVRIPKGILFPLVMMTCIAGAYSVKNSLFDVYIMICSGIIGYLMTKFEFPLAALLIAYLLGLPLERGFRQSLIMGEGSPVIFFQRPICLIFLVLTIATLIYMVWRQLAGKKTERR